MPALRKELEEAIAAWRETKDPRWGAIAVWAGTEGGELQLVGAGKKATDREAWEQLEKKGDPIDLPRLVRALGKMSAAEAAERLPILAKREDPRLFTELIGFLEAPPWRANVFKVFVNALIQVVSQSGDPRAAAAFSDLSERYRGIIETTVGDWTGGKLRTAATMLARDDFQPVSLSADQRARLAAAEAKFSRQLDDQARATRSTKRHQQTDEQFLEAIYAAPADDHPRLVFADALSERGDPRGELITIQIRHAAGDRTSLTVQREAELLSDPKRRDRWGLPLSQGAEVWFHRGFPDRIAIRAKNGAKLRGLPALALVTELEAAEQLSAKLAGELLELPNLREVSTVNTELLERLDPKPRPWTKLQLNGPMPIPAVAQTLAAVRTLTLYRQQIPPAPESLAAFSAVEDLHLAGAAFTADELKPFKQLRRLTVQRGLGWVGALKQLDSLEQLEVFGPLSPSAVEGLGLTGLKLQEAIASAAVLRPLLEVLPKLQTLSLARFQLPSLLPLLEVIDGTSVKEVVVEHRNNRYSVRDRALTIRQLSHGPEMVDILSDALEAGRIERARVIPERPRWLAAAVMASEDRILGHDALLKKFGITLERDWLGLPE